MTYLKVLAIVILMGIGISLNSWGNDHSCMTRIMAMYWPDWPYMQSKDNILFYEANDNRVLTKIVYNLDIIKRSHVCYTNTRIVALFRDPQNNLLQYYVSKKPYSSTHERVNIEFPTDFTRTP